MTYTELCKLFNFELPSYCEEYFESFMAEYNRNKAVLSAEEAIFVAEKTRLPEAGKDELIRCAEIINSDGNAHLCASFMAYITVYKRAPWLNYIYCDNHFTVEGLYPEQVGWVIVAVMEYNTLAYKNPPEDLNYENVSAFYGYTLACFREKGYWGILEWNWNMLSAGGCMFVFDILKYVPAEFTDDFRVITDGESYVSLAKGEFFVGKNGDLVDSAEKAEFTTSFYEDEAKYIAHVISKDGIVESTPTEFSKEAWSDYLRGGTHTLEIHIPQRIEYTPERIKKAHKTALEFYKDFYPDHYPKAISCYSWLYSPQLKYVFDEDSNIIKVNDSLHLLPVIATFDADCRFIREGSTLQKRIAKECEKGREFHYGISYITLSELD